MFQYIISKSTVGLDMMWNVKPSSCYHWLSPTRRSATAKLMRRNEVRFILLRFFQNANVVKEFPEKIRRDSKRIMQWITNVTWATLEVFSIRKIYQRFLAGCHLRSTLLYKKKNTPTVWCSWLKKEKINKHILQLTPTNIQLKNIVIKIFIKRISL